MARGVNWISKRKYEIRVRAYDKYSNTETAHGIQIYIDYDEPVSTVTIPVDNDFVSVLSQISGEVSDDFGGYFSTMSKVEIHIRDIYYEPDKYWNGSQWLDVSGAPVFIKAGTPTVTTWQYDISAWQSGHEYEITSRAYDKAGNIEVALSTSSFVFDASEPDSGVSAPVDNGDYQNISEITGTSKDLPEGGALQNAGVNVVKLRIKDETAEPDAWWTGTEWSTYTIKWLDVTAPYDNWSYTTGDIWTSNRRYYINTKAWDKAEPSNEEMAISTMSFVIDRSSPTSEINTPQNNAALSSRPTQITGTSKDDEALSVKAGIDKVWIEIQDITLSTQPFWNSNTASWQSAEFWIETDNNEPDWIVSINTNAWTDTHQYRLRIKAQDRAGNWQYGSPEYTYFYYDETEPTSGITLPVDGNYYPLGEPSTIEGTSADAGSGIDKVEIQVKKLSDGTYLSNADQKFYITEEWIEISGALNPWSYTINYPTATWERVIWLYPVQQIKQAMLKVNLQ